MRYLKADEIKIASRFLFLSMAITVLELDLQHVQRGKFKIKEPYIEAIERMISLALEERRKLRKEMHKRKLSVHQIRKDDLFTSYLFICNRREEERTYFNPVLRRKVKEIIYQLLREIPQQKGDRRPNPEGMKNVDKKNDVTL